MATHKKSPPLHKIRLGAIHADIWLVTPDNGQPFLTVSFSRSYKQGEQWKTGHSFQAHELEALSDVAADAKAWMKPYRHSHPGVA
ncbi:MAG: hypothetical protein NPIRA01_20410 [Nitrospirales bacterium]|nr:MAG: hypothetical protein NPIRA01_20410 [Nitrospirales bacterium]